MCLRVFQIKDHECLLLKLFLALIIDLYNDLTCPSTFYLGFCFDMPPEILFGLSIMDFQNYHHVDLTCPQVFVWVFNLTYPLVFCLGFLLWVFQQCHHVDLTCPQYFVWAFCHGSQHYVDLICCSILKSFLFMLHNFFRHFFLSLRTILQIESVFFIFALAPSVGCDPCQD